ncbi:MAG: ParB family protein [Scandinavium sp.]|uniref:ParB family protein n=1 Tax=Scandinavium sp. TaxID=2830653 RepID=UPI003F2D148C
MKAEQQGVLMPVTLDQLRAFGLNPRLTQNRNYDAIKESVRQRGLEHLLQITKRPGDAFYVIASGGNTRLAVMNDLWLETHDKKYWDLVCIYRPWEESKSVEEGDLHCLLGHLVENEQRGSLTFIERALGVQSAADIYQGIQPACNQQTLLRMFEEEGYAISKNVLSSMLSAISYLLPHIPELLYGGLSRKTVEQILAVRSAANKFWEKHCRELPPEEEQRLPLFDDVFSLALLPFGGLDPAFSLRLLQDEVSHVVSQQLNVSFNLVTLETDLKSQKRIEMMGEAEMVIPPYSEQRHVEPKYQSKPANAEKAAPAGTTENHSSDGILPQEEPGSTDTFLVDEVTGASSGGEPGQVVNDKLSFSAGSDTVSSRQPSTRPLLAGAHGFYPDNDPQFDTPESLASIIDQTAWELAGHAGLEFLVTQTESGVFDIAGPEEELTNEGKLYWQMLAFLAGKLPGRAIVWRQMLLGSENAPAGFSDTSLEQLFLLIRSIRRLYVKRNEEESTCSSH